jgi:uncharacterized protein YecT (DUF1311 family)
LIKAVALGLFVVSAASALAAERPNARDSALIQGCIKSAGGSETAERCIGKVSDPCLDKDSTRSTADMTACVDREQAVWDHILNETYRRLRAKLDAQQQEKLREMQRAWIASRDRTCAFYWDYYQGTMATPMSASCTNREIARRALFLLGFLEDTESK